MPRSKMKDIMEQQKILVGLDQPERTLEEKEIRAASLTVCNRAEDVEDARILLDMLGLVPDPVRFPSWVTPTRAAARAMPTPPASPLPPARYGGVPA